MPLDLPEAKRRARHALSDISAPSGKVHSGDFDPHSLPPSEFPLPELLNFGLCTIHGLHSDGPWEKVRWSISGEYKGIPFALYFQKFGLRLSLPKGVDQGDYDGLISRLKAAAGIAQGVLRDVAAQQIHDGNVTIENLYHQFDGSYRYFREQAHKCYKAPAPEPTPIPAGGSSLGGWSSDPWKSQREGGYHAGAMLDAYFSRLEHLLVLVLPFTDFDPASGGLVDFVGLTWGDKWRALYDLDTDPPAKQAFDDLSDIKETVRNPSAHGGFMKRGMSFYFHAGHHGALPALLSKHGCTFQARVTRVAQDTFEDLCKRLDQIDKFLESSHLGPAVTYAQSGLTINFSSDFMESCKEAATSGEGLEAFMHHQSYVEDMHANMDY